MATATMPHVEADSASIYSHRSQSHPHPHLHRSHGSNGHHHHHHHHHRKRSKNGPAAVGGSLDVHVRVHSAEAFWQGEPVSQRVGSVLGESLAESDRARSRGGATRGRYVDPAGQYPPNVHQLLRGLSRQVGSFPRPCYLLCELMSSRRIPPIDTRHGQRHIPPARLRTVSIPPRPDDRDHHD
jgi:hypothetical protein